MLLPRICLQPQFLLCAKSCYIIIDDNYVNGHPQNLFVKGTNSRKFCTSKFPNIPYIQRIIRYCSKATSQTHATFCDLRARIECNECVLSMRTSLDFRILYAKTSVAKESSATGCKYIDRFIRRRVFFVNLA